MRLLDACVMTTRSRARMENKAVYPAVPIAMASLVENADGSLTSHSPFTRAFCANPP